MTLARFGFLLGVSATIAIPTAQAAQQALPSPTVPVQTGSDTAPHTAPIVHDDRTVTFTLRAPEAKNVEIMVVPPQIRQRMSKVADGTWTVTLGPWEPGLRQYVFLVDGVRVVDEANSAISISRSRIDSLVDIPALPPRIDQEQDVPHGSIEIRQYKSTALGLDRRLYVYLPPDYDREPTRRFPVLYLRHGNGDIETNWNQPGRAGVILDNLLSQKKAVPMIIVMPNGYPSVMGSGSDDAGIEKVGRELVSDIVPFIDTHYRTIATAQSRALAGLSMGAGQAFVTGLKHSELFGSVGAFSSGRIGNASYRIEDDFPGFLRDANKTNAEFRLLFLSCGTEDPRYAGYVKLVDTLKQRGIAVEWFGTAGDHEWKVWRASLAQMLPKLFRSA